MLRLKLSGEKLSYHYDFPAQPFHLLIAALHQHHNVIGITSAHSLTHWAPKKQKAALPISQTNSHLHLLFFPFYSSSIKGSRYRRFLFIFFFSFFTTELASLFFHKAFSKDDRPFTSSTAAIGDLRANPHSHLKDTFLFPLLPRSPGQLMFLRFSRSLS